MTDIQRMHLRPDAEKAFGFSQAVRVGDTIQVAGTLSVDDDFQPLHAGDMGAQIEQVYASIGLTLAHFGASMGNVVKETIFVTDMNAFLEANGKRLAALGSNLPVATAVEVRQLAFPQCMIEIEVVAAL